MNSCEKKITSTANRRIGAGLTAALVLALLLGSIGSTPGQVPGQNVNMVSGTDWPGGDPFLQRQNEPSIADSSRNPRHLLAGANDYRTVDLPGLPTDGPIGDAWLGVFKSFDGGQSWQSTLLPGFPQDNSPEGLASPLKGYTAAADPVVRAGTHGLFYYLGITFNRGTNLGQVFVARFIDLNNKENGDVALNLDPIKYTGTFSVDSGTSGQFLDKAWIAVAAPTANAPTCTIPTDPPQTVPAGEVYVTFSKFTGSNTSKIMFTKSTDCGETWSHPIKLSESNTLNQGTTLAIDPTNGDIHAAWRRFNTSSNSNAIVYAKSTDRGKKFSMAREIAEVLPFDQGTTRHSFRTSAYPVMAVSVDSAGHSFIHAAWAQRMSELGDARVVLSTSSNGRSWSAPTPVDDTPLQDDSGNVFSRGHQFMPAMTFSAGKLMLLYYDVRLDHTVGLYTPNEPFEPDENGEYYQEERSPRGELPDSPDEVFTPYLTDENMVSWRHTVDVRVAQSDGGSTPGFTSTRVSHFPFGTRGDESGLIEYAQQLQVNPPNLPLFGDVPFFGDYIDIIGPAFLPPQTENGTWSYNTEPTSAPVHYAVWTSNQDVRPPLDGDWANYTPIGGGGTSVFDPGQTTQSCVPGQEGMRNQNIYFSKISQGLLVSSPQNSKPLSATLTRALVVNAHNFTNQARVLRLSIVNQPIDGKASFLQFPGPGDPDPLTVLDLDVAALSGVTRSVFTTSSAPAAQVRVEVHEVDGQGGDPVAGGLSGFITFNADDTAPALVNPDGTGDDIAVVEIYAPDITNPLVIDPNAGNPDAINPYLSNPEVQNPNVLNSTTFNPDLGDIDVRNPNVLNSTEVNTGTTKPGGGGSNLRSAPISDAVYTVTNEGNTSASYRVKLVGDEPEGAELQLLIAKNYTTPLGLNCELQAQRQNIIMANVPDPVFEDSGNLTDPRITDPNESNGTFWLRPGETALITLRGTLSIPEMEQLASEVAPVIIPHAANTYAAPLFIGTTELPEATVGQPYSAALEAFGMEGDVSWSVSSGELPGDLALDPLTGEISGVPLTAGTFDVTVQVTDSDEPPATGQRDLSLLVNPVETTTAVVSSVNPSVFGQQVSLTATVTPATSDAGDPDGEVSFKNGATVLGSASLSGGSASFYTSDLSVGAHEITAEYTGSTSFAASVSAAFTQSVDRAAASVALSAAPNPSVLGQPVTFTAAVAAVSPGAGEPGGEVTFKEGEAVLGTAVLVGGSAAFTQSAPTLGDHAVTAVYAGDDNFELASSAALIQSVGPAATVTSVASSANPSVFGQPVTFSAAVVALPPEAGTPEGSVTFMDGGVSLGTATLTGGVATLTTSALAAGAHSIQAAYQGSPGFTGSSSAPLSQAVNPASSSTTLVSSVTPSVLGEEVSFTAIVQAVAPGAGLPTGTVSFDDGGVLLGTAALSGGTASFATSALSVGVHSITATYAGDDSFAASVSAAWSQSVDRAESSTALDSSPNPSLLGASVTFTVTVSSAGAVAITPTGSVTILDDGAALGSATLSGGTAQLTFSSLAVGTNAITAVYAGDGNFNGSTSSVLSQAVEQAGSTTSLVSAPNPSVLGQPISLTATVDAAGAVPYAPTGTVTFTENGEVLGTATLSGGSASISTSELLSGPREITAVYAGDASFAGSSSATLIHSVNYVFDGFESPMAPAGTYDEPSFSPAANLGSAVPLKWRLTDYGGGTIRELSTLVSMRAEFNPDCSGPPEGPGVTLYSPTSGATGGSEFRRRSHGFIFNWDTSTGVETGPGCYSVILELDDGSAPRATIVELQ